MAQNLQRESHLQAESGDTCYTSLAFESNSHEFRLVKLLPGQWNDPLRCELFIRDLEDVSKIEPYQALSYVWGSPRVTDQIYLESFPVKVTLNLASALHHLRHTNQSISLWVDALVSCVKVSSK